MKLEVINATCGYGSNMVIKNISMNVEGEEILMQKNNVFTIGTVDEVVTEANLKLAYGANVKIASVKNTKGEIVKSCIPMINKSCL